MLRLACIHSFTQGELSRSGICKTASELTLLLLKPSHVPMSALLSLPTLCLCMTWQVLPTHYGCHWHGTCVSPWPLQVPNTTP